MSSILNDMGGDVGGRAQVCVKTETRHADVQSGVSTWGATDWGGHH